MSTWPSTLPQRPQVDGYGRTPVDNTIETETDAGGIPKKRRRFSAAVDIITVSYHMTRAQKATFDTFWRTTTYMGVLSFSWPDPDTDTVKTVQFVKDSVKDSPEGVEHRVSFSLRIFL